MGLVVVVDQYFKGLFHVAKTKQICTGEVDQQEDGGDGHKINKVDGAEQDHRQPGHSSYKQGTDRMSQRQKPGIANQLHSGTVKSCVKQGQQRLKQRHDSQANDGRPELDAVVAAGVVDAQNGHRTQDQDQDAQ